LQISSESHKYFHTVERRNVSFTYYCTGNAFNRWGVDGHDISNFPFLMHHKSHSSSGCVNNFTLTLYDVKLNYSKAYTAYPSMSKHFNKTGINMTFHLSKWSILVNTFILDGTYVYT